MTPVFIYTKNGRYHVYSGTTVVTTHDGYKLIASIDVGPWLTALFNYDSKNRNRMIKEIKEGTK